MKSITKRNLQTHERIYEFSVGDEIVVYFDGNIAETEPLQLGTVYAIILKTSENSEQVS